VDRRAERRGGFWTVDNEYFITRPPIASLNTRAMRERKPTAQGSRARTPIWYAHWNRRRPSRDDDHNQTVCAMECYARGAGGRLKPHFLWQNWTCNKTKARCPYQADFLEGTAPKAGFDDHAAGFAWSTARSILYAV